MPHHRRIQVNVGDRQVPVEVVAPDSSADAPGILYLHEIFGVLDAYREDAEDLARHGYVVYLPDLYAGIGATRYCIRAMVHSAGRKNTADNPLAQEVHALLDALKSDNQCNGKLGIIGACLTGGFVLHMAKRPDMQAPVIYHHSLGLEGSGVPRKDNLHEVRLIQGHWAKTDPFCPSRRRRLLREQLGERLEAYEYDMPHGFRSLSRGRPDADVVWQRTLDFFARQLGDTVPSNPG